MTAVPLDAITRAICCPSGTCCSPAACYLLDKTRDVPVRIHEAAAAVKAAVEAEAEAVGR